MTRSRKTSENPVLRVADNLVGDRLRNAIEWRVRKEVSSSSGELAKALRSEAARTVIAEEVARHVGGSDFTLSVLTGSRTRSKRVLNPGGWRKLNSEIVELTGESTAEWPMTQAFRSVLAAEMLGLGRIAGGPYNIIGKLVVPPLLTPPDGPVLEIGTLYGLFSPQLIRAFRRVGSFRDLTVIDPFAGLQLQGGENLKPDRSTTPVSKQVAEHNMRSFGLKDDEFRIIEGFSTDAKVQAAAADRKYAVVVIDGDHFEDGVYKDLWWVEKIVKPGAIVVMDDFGDPKWPGVEKAARRYLADGGKLTLLGSASTSGYLRMPG